jgi:hypothetical protein
VGMADTAVGMARAVVVIVDRAVAVVCTP